MSSTPSTSTTTSTPSSRSKGLPKSPTRRLQQPPLITTSHFLLAHVFCIALYLVPILTTSNANTHTNTKYGINPPHTLAPVLDEIHIVSPDNADVNDPNATLRNIFTNDYWGRPMQAPNSHKSWRPLSILSFRYLQGGHVDQSQWWWWLRYCTGFSLPPLLAHRLVNVVTHACLAEMVGILAAQLVPSPDAHFRRLLRLVAKIAFGLHPTHVEVTANAANRPHLLALLASLAALDAGSSIASSTTVWPWLRTLLFLVAGFLSCETFLFQTVPIVVTYTVLVYVQLYHNAPTSGSSRRVYRQRNGWWYRQLWSLVPIVRLRVALVVASGILYYTARSALDTLSIPDGLIRPAENPFFALQGWHRVRNYLYIVAVHVAKAWDLDVLGFSHEYGYNCVPEINEWTDRRLLLPLTIAVLYLATAVFFLVQHARRRQVWSIPFLLFVVHVSWMVTLFPVAGIVKVGTFVADRIVVASSVSTSIVLAYVATRWMTAPRSRTAVTRRVTLLALTVGVFQTHRVYVRTTQWMDSYPLLTSSLVTCPRFAKGHLELSKIYSGLYPERFNLTTARWHLARVEDIDPTFCDVHQQVAHVAIQERRYEEFEERLVQALLCPFTLGGATDLWQRYWKITLNSQQNPSDVVAAAEQRYQTYMKRIQVAIQQEQENEPVPVSTSPIVGWQK
uniref:Transmembrane protein n=1 Tax=Phaeodactylum tricornutum TaxID=2850 RepID=A0A8J9X2F0_PHATR